MSDEAFETLMGSADPPLIVLTTAAEGERAGCLVGFHAQSSITPPHYSVWLSKANHTYRVALHASHVAVHFPAQGDLEIARLFGTTTGDDVDKLAAVDWEAGPGGVPLLSSLPNRFVGRRVTLLDDGSDHVCLVLEPTETWGDGTLRPLRLAGAQDLEPGHDSHDRPTPAALRTR